MEHQKGSLLAKQFKDFIRMWIASEFNFQKKKNASLSWNKYYSPNNCDGIDKSWNKNMQWGRVYVVLRRSSTKRRMIWSLFRVLGRSLEKFSGLLTMNAVITRFLYFYILLFHWNLIMILVWEPSLYITFSFSSNANYLV